MKQTKRFDSGDPTAAKAVTLCLVLALLAAGCAAVDGPPAVQGQSLDPARLLARSLAVYGGAQAVTEFEDLTLLCRIRARLGETWIEGRTLLRFKPPRALLSLVVLEDGSRQLAWCDGEDQGERVNGRDVERDVSADLDQRRRLLMIHAFFLEEDGRHALFEGLDEAEGARCAVLSRKDGERTWQLWIDPEDATIRKIRLDMPSAQEATGLPGEMTVEWTYGGFETRQGRLVPRTYAIRLNGRLFQEGEVLRFALNQGLSLDDFSREATRKAAMPEE